MWTFIRLIRPEAALGFVIVLSFLIFNEAWLSLIGIWGQSETYSHGYLILPISAWMIWREREHFFSGPFNGSAIGVLALILASAGWIFSQVANVSIASHFFLVALTLGLVWAVLGDKFVIRTWFPLAFLFFMVPAGEFLNLPLMHQTAEVTVWALTTAGIPVYRDGLQFILPTGHWSVVEACSGLRYVIASFILASVFAYINLASWWGRFLFVSSALIVSVIANWIRAFTVVLVGHFSDMRYGTGDDHVWYGWFFFGVVMSLVFYVGSRLGTIQTSTPPNSPTSGPERFTPSSFSIAVLLCCGIALTAVSIWTAGLGNRTVQIDNVFEGINKDSSWRQASLQFTPGFQNAKAHVGFKSAQTDGLEMFGAYYANQSRTQKMISASNSTVSQDEVRRWLVNEIGSAAPVLGRIGTITVEELVISKGSQRRLVWTLYLVGERVTGSRYLAPVFVGLNLIRSGTDNSVALVLSIAIRPGESTESARAALGAAANEAVQLVTPYLSPSLK